MFSERTNIEKSVYIFQDTKNRLIQPVYLENDLIAEIDWTRLEDKISSISPDAASCILFELNSETVEKLHHFGNISIPVIGIVQQDFAESISIDRDILDFLYIYQNDIDYAFLNALIFQLTLQKTVLQKFDENIKSSSSPSHDFIYPLPGKSEFIAELNRKLSTIAETDLPVLLTGPTGSGKSVIARIIHALSPYKEKMPVELDCHAININLIESELFGFEKGAFTGATRDRKGKFEEADHNTLILEEITGLTPDLQSKLLNVLDTHRFIPLGSHREIHSHFRLISTTNHNPHQLISEGKLKIEFYFRINAIRIDIPPLFERKEDIIPTFSALWEKQIKKHPDIVPEISREFLEELEGYHWPGNLKEMENIIRQILFIRPEVVTPDFFKFILISNQSPDLRLLNQNIFPIEELKKIYIRSIASTFDLSKKELAAKLGIDYKTLKKYL